MKYTLLALFVLTMTACQSRDKLLVSIIKSDQEHLNRYNWIQRHTTDTSLIYMIDSIKETFKLTAVKLQVMMENYESENLNQSLVLIKTYQDSCYKFKNK